MPDMNQDDIAAQPVKVNNAFVEKRQKTRDTIIKHYYEKSKSKPTEEDINQKKQGLISSLTNDLFDISQEGLEQKETPVFSEVSSYENNIKLLAGEKEIEHNPFLRAIYRLTLIDDLDKGIDSEYVYKEGELFLFRDARAQKIEALTEENEGWANWAIIGFNLMDAINVLAEAKGIKKSNACLHLMANQFLAKMVDEKNKNTKEARKVLVEFTKDVLIPFAANLLQVTEEIAKEKLGIDKLKIEKKDEDEKESEINGKDQIAAARDFCNFRLPDYSMGTATRVDDAKDYNDDDSSNNNNAVAESEAEPDKVILDIDVPVKDLPPGELRDQYALLHGAKQGINDPTIQTMLWFKSHPADVQELILKNIQDFETVDEFLKKPFPTQIRKFMPGPRNGGEAWTYDVSNVPEHQEEEKEFKLPLIQHSHHSGNPGHELPTDNEWATRQTLKDMKKLTGATHFVCCTLTTPGAPEKIGGDKKITAMLKDAIQDLRAQNFHFVNLPLHGSRNVMRNEWEGLNFILEEANKISNDEKNGEAKKVKEDLDFYIKAYKDLRDDYHFRPRFWKRDPEVLNHRAIFYAQKMAELINQAKGDDNYIVLQVVCKSGKDRTGLSRVFSYVSAAATYFYKKQFKGMIDIFSEEANDIYTRVRRAITRSNQPGKQAGGPLGSLGCCGFLHGLNGKFFNLIESAIPRSWRKDPETSTLCRKTAKDNKGVPKGKKRWYKSYKFWIGVGLIVASIGLCITLVGIPASLWLGSVGTGLAIAGAGFTFSSLVYTFCEKSKSTMGKILAFLGFAAGAACLGIAAAPAAAVAFAAKAPWLGTVANALPVIENALLAAPVVAEVGGAVVGVGGVAAVRYAGDHLWHDREKYKIGKAYTPVPEKSVLKDEIIPILDQYHQKKQKEELPKVHHSVVDILSGIRYEYETSLSCVLGSENGEDDNDDVKSHVSETGNEPENDEPKEIESDDESEFFDGDDNLISQGAVSKTDDEETDDKVIVTDESKDTQVNVKPLYHSM